MGANPEVEPRRLRRGGLIGASALGSPGTRNSKPGTTDSIDHGWPGAAEPQPNRNWILQEAAEGTEKAFPRMARMNADRAMLSGSVSVASVVNWIRMCPEHDWNR